MNQQDLDSYFEFRCRRGLESLSLGDNKEYTDRLDYEIKCIRDMGFSGYLLIVQDFIEWSVRNDILVGVARGSSAGSLCCYVLGITKVDPIRHNLIFERFLNPGRAGSAPDIDTDFEIDRRDEVVQYVKEVYGADRVARITTFSEMQAKGAIRDVARVIGLDYMDGDKLSKAIKEGASISESLEENEEFIKLYKNKSNPLFKETVDLAQRLEGTIRNKSVHAAGIVIGNKSLSEYMPVYKSEEDNISQFSMGDVEDVGLIKFDFLGLKNLSIVHMTQRIVEETKGEKIDLDSLTKTLNDPEVIKMFARGETTNVFQFESDGMKEYLKKLQPTCFNDIVALNALYRPAGIDSGIINKYIARKNDPSLVEYPHECMKPYLKDTYGLVVFQENQMKICEVLAGYSLTEADTVRKCLHEDTLMWTPNGYKTIKQLAGEKKQSEERPKILTLVDNKHKYNKACAVFSSGIKPTVKVTTKSSTELICTPDHKILTNNGWKQAKDLTDNDWLMHCLKEKYGTYSIDESLLFVCIALITEGYTPEKLSVWTFTNKDKEYINKFLKCCKDILKYDLPYDTNVNEITTIRLSKHAVETLMQLSKIGHGLSGTKCLPDNFINLSATLLHKMLSWLIDFDGWCMQDKLGRVELGYGTKSYLLAQQVKLAMCNCGVKATINKSTDYKGDTHYSVLVLSLSDICKLKSKLIWSKKISNFKATKLETAISKGYLIPNNVWRPKLESLIEATGYKRNQLIGNNMVGGSYFNKPISTKRLSKLLANIGKQKELELYTSEEVYWDRVSTVEQHIDSNVYDFTMNSGVAPYAYGNNIIVHNCIGKKKLDELKKERPKFVKGCMTKGLSKAKAEALFDDLEKAGRYSFNASHSVSYSIIAYWTAWLKKYYPVEYMTAVLSYEIDNPDKLVKYIKEAKDMEIEILPPDINKSKSLFFVEDGAIRYGLSALISVGVQAADEIIKVRKEKGDFKSVRSIIELCDSRKATSRVIQQLIKSGALDSLEYDRHYMLSFIEPAATFKKKRLSKVQKHQLTLFKEVIDFTDIEPEDYERPPQSEIDNYETESFGFYMYENPLDVYKHVIDANVNCSIEQVKEKEVEGKDLKVAGIITAVKPGISKKHQEKMCWIDISDGINTCQVAIFVHQFKRFGHLIKKNELVLIQGGMLTRENEEGKIAAQQMQVLRFMPKVETIDNTLTMHYTDGSAIVIELTQNKNCIPKFKKLLKNFKM